MRMRGKRMMLNFLLFCAMTYFLKCFNMEIDFSSQNLRWSVEESIDLSSSILSRLHFFFFILVSSQGFSFSSVFNVYIGIFLLDQESIRLYCSLGVQSTFGSPIKVWESNHFWESNQTFGSPIKPLGVQSEKNILKKSYSRHYFQNRIQIFKNF